ncbi:hypothetical protein C2S53_016629 [Perilla frutescens var. hirtella]|uniref:Uncharacterized protein n=1 Tax=Perilla frutescens var. hirtella TaxID=608512 RepID=A0AAD4IY03_PERFH|nr:hypothetical protein C2S53_016629 [Perilla frutescens var. hirtella]
MVRAPCCEKAGLKKGPWTTEEDRILINFINQNGHDNWRALPKRAGLLRCGKSCRLRWVNYLRPDIKRGNFTWEEEEAIIKLHAELGNKWSVIAARLPGRTDNEIKNVWHTHLKKRVAGKSEKGTVKVEYSSESDRNVEKYSELSSPGNSLSEVSSVAGAGGDNDFVVADLLDQWTEMGESFWSEVFPAEEWSGGSDSQLQFENSFPAELDGEDGNDFWRDVFNRAEEFTKYI